MYRPVEVERWLHKRGATTGTLRLDRAVNFTLQRAALWEADAEGGGHLAAAHLAMLDLLADSQTERLFPGCQPDLVRACLGLRSSR